MTTAQDKADRASRILKAVYAKRAPWAVQRRAERLYFRLANQAFVVKHMARKGLI